MVKAKQFIFMKYFEGVPQKSDLQLVEKELPPIQDGEFLVEVKYLSVDPYMRSHNRYVPLGTPFIGSSVGKIIESKNKDFPVGRYVVGNYNWQNYVISNGKKIPGHLFDQDPYLLPDFGNIDISTSLDVLGMPGNTAYFGVTKILKPKKGETIVISGAAGAVGSVIGQLTKLRGCKVIGIAGSDEKCRWLVNKLGFDHAINYKTENIVEALKKVAPEGVDGYFDHVGGDITYSVMTQMNNFGRVAICGAISIYNDEKPKMKCFDRLIVTKQLTFQGFHVHDYFDVWFEGILHNLELMKQGKLISEQTITEGFENMFEGFVSMLNGGNRGKALIKV